MTTIERIILELWNYPLEHSLGGSGIREVGIVTAELTTNDHTGTGFTYVLGDRAPHVFHTAAHLASKVLIHNQLDTPHRHWEQLTQSLNRVGRGIGYVAIAALDLALWDLHSKRLGVPLGKALGGTPRPVPTYGSGGYTTTQTPAETAAQAAHHVAAGFRAIKLRLAGNRTDLDRIDAIRNEYGPDIIIMGDFNEKTNLAALTPLLPELAKRNLAWIEEPFPAENIDEYQALTNLSGPAVATGEHLQGRIETDLYLTQQLCTVIQPDLAMIGGITPTHQLATHAATHNMTVAPHFLPQLFAHLAAAHPNVTWLEDFPLLEPLFTNQPNYDTGTLQPNAEPGHGIEWQPEVADRLRTTQVVLT
jgi:L-alanine-DL-glutamate epimerase-like enolase superfamily enzyme